jgi:hypothetical protein
LEGKYVTEAEEKALQIICGESFAEDRLNCVSGVWSGPMEIVHSWKDLLTAVYLATVYVLLELLLILKD